MAMSEAPHCAKKAGPGLKVVFFRAMSFKTNKCIHIGGKYKLKSEVCAIGGAGIKVFLNLPLRRR